VCLGAAEEGFPLRGAPRMRREKEWGGGGGGWLGGGQCGGGSVWWRRSGEDNGWSVPDVGKGMREGVDSAEEPPAARIRLYGG
jgi:hypothetical protein